MKFKIDPERVISTRDRMIYGQFLEHHHRQIYGGVFDPASKFADEDGFRTDVLEALREIQTPIIRWPGGCFVSAYDWKKGVGKRVPAYDKAWLVEDPNTFGTDEFISLCRKLNCEPYICTNAGTGTPEEMSDWMEYCNLKNEGLYARQRIENGHTEPYGVKYWSIGNENYGSWEMGAKESAEWSRFVTESAKMMIRVSPEAELSAAALGDPEWNFNLFKKAGNLLDWISIHSYWDWMPLSDYGACMAYTTDLDSQIVKVKGMMAALGYSNIRIAYDEWNLRAWYHPNIDVRKRPYTYENIVAPRFVNDINAQYTMADAVFTACFLNMLHRHADTVRMATFSPAVNTRGMIFTHENGIVKRSMWHVYRLYTQRMFEQVIDLYANDSEKAAFTDKNGKEVLVDAIDCVATRSPESGRLGISIVNKKPNETATVSFSLPKIADQAELFTVNGESADDYNDIDRENIRIRENNSGVKIEGNVITVTIEPHSVNVLNVR